MPRYDDETVLSWINEAQNDFCRRTRCLSSIAKFSLASGDTSFPLPGDFISELALTVTVGDSAVFYLKRVSIELIRNIRAGTTGFPAMWSIDGRNIIVDKSFKSDDAFLTLSYSRLPRQITDPNDGVSSSEIPPAYHSAIVNYATALGLLQDEELTRAKFYFDLYERDLRRAQDEFATGYSSSPNDNIRDSYLTESGRFGII